VLVPAAEEASAKTHTQRIGVAATEGTVQSGAFIRELKKINPRTKIFQNACPLLVPIIEEGEQDSEAARLILKKYLAPLIKKRIDTLILGCTHYGIMERQIKAIISKEIAIISEARVVPKKLRDYLKKHPEVEQGISRHGTIKFYTTDLTEKFTKLGSKFFGKKIDAQKIILS